MAAPTDSARQGTNVTTAGATWSVNVGSPVAGTLLIVLIRAAGAAGGATFSGYTALVTAEASDATDDETFIYYRYADGAEGATATWDPVNSVKGSAISWEILGAEHPSASPPRVSSVNVGTTTANTAQSNSVAPPEPPRDTLYLSLMGLDGEGNAPTVAPTNYGNLVTANSGTAGSAATNNSVGGASRSIAASTSDDPGVFTHAAATGGWTAYTLAIVGPHVYPRNPAVQHQNPGLLMEAARRGWKRSRGILVPRLWLPDGVSI